MKKRILSILLLCCMVLTLLPTAAFAADTGKAIQLGTDALSKNVNTASAPTVYFGQDHENNPAAWRVIGYNGNGVASAQGDMTLLAAGNMSSVLQFADFGTNNRYASSYLKTAIDALAEKLTTEENTAVKKRTLTSGSYNGENTDCVAGEQVDNAVFWPLSTAEAFAVNQDLRIVDPEHPSWASSYWWLRSPGYSDHDAATVNGDGSVVYSGNAISSWWCVRPAFNLNSSSVLFTSAAVGGKPDGGLTPISKYTGNEWKLTLKDSNRNFAVTETTVSGDPGDTVTLHYTGATAGINEYISVILADNSGAQYYGRVAQPTAENGTVEIKIPSGLAPGSYTLKVFSEQCNDDKKTDYASDFVDIDLTVGYQEQFTLTPGGVYYFDLSGVSIPGTANGSLPDKTMHYVPFTYAGTVDAYKLTSEMATTEEYAQQNEYAHSLFVADYAVTHAVSWDDLNATGLIFGKGYATGSVDYTLRAPSGGSGGTGSGALERGTPQSNEWDRILDKDDGYIKNWRDIGSWGQDTLPNTLSNRVIRGRYDLPRKYAGANTTLSFKFLGFRPVLEVLNSDTLGSDGLKAVTLDLGGGKFGGSSDTIQIIVKTGESFTAPASDGLTRPDGNTGSYFMWRDNDGQLYAPGDNVPADVTKLTAQFVPPEQFTLAPGGTYYFDLSGVSIPGTVNDALPDNTLHYVPFTYAGTVDAYKLTSAMATTEEYAQREKYPHSLFIADHAVTHTVSWNDLNAAGLIFDKDYADGGVSYTLRAPSAGSSSTGSSFSIHGAPQSNEWDRILDKDERYIQNIVGLYSWGQDTPSASASQRVGRGYYPLRGWSSAPASHQDAVAGFRPVLEVLSPGSLGSDGLKAVTLDLDGGKLGNSSEDIQIIVKSGESFAAPASDGLTRPDGNTDNYFKWLGSDGELYEPGDNVSADVTKLTAQFNLPEQFTLAPGGTYYFDLSGAGIPGTANDALPDATLHYVPFTYAGMVNAYKLTSAMETTEEYAEQNKYDHSLFVAEYNVTRAVSWIDLNTAGLIFGKDYTSDGVDYTLRAPSVGSASTGSYDLERGTPQSNEWDKILDKGNGYIKNWEGMESWGQDIMEDLDVSAHRGHMSARYWNCSTDTFSQLYHGFRPVLEVLGLDTLGADGLKAVTLDLGDGKLGVESSIQIIVIDDSTFTAPASDGLTRPDGNTGSYFMWLGSDGKLYDPGDNVPADVTKLTAQFASSSHSVTITTATLPDGKVGEAYSQTLIATGTTPITWSIIGALPDGLSLNKDTGKISGTPTAAGSSTFTVKATNSAGSNTKELSITIAKAAPTEYTVRFNANGGGGTMADVTGVSGSYTLPSCGFTEPEGKQFKGWSTSADGSVISGTTYEVSSDTTFYAIWESKEYSIIVTDGKATIGAGSEISKAAQGTTITLTANAAPDGKVFDKWVVESGNTTLEDANSETTTFIMPDSEVSVKATYTIPHTHTYDQEIQKPETLKSAADCTNDAVYFKSCSCGEISTTETFTAAGTQLGHAWASDWSKDTDNHWKECSRCHEKKDEAAHDYGSDNICDTCGYDKTVPHTHNLTLVPAKAPTCTEKGNTAYYTCDGCDKWFEDATGASEITDKTSVILAATGHSASDWKSDNTDHWKECTVVSCGVIIEGSKAAHTAGEWIIDTPATATTSGSKHKECTVCGYTMATETIPATGGGEHTHSYGSEWKNDADNHWHECSCGDKKDTAAHTAGEWIIDTPATATTSGTKHKKCTVCGYTMTIETIPATGGGEHTHSYGSDWKNDATNHWHECSCGDKKDTAAHTAGEWIIDTPATATTDGSKHKECTVCGYTMTIETIPATGGGEHTHSYGSDWKNDATNHWHECSCGDKADKAAHDFKWVVDKEATATQKGSKHEECRVCGYKKAAVEIPATGTPTEPGKPTDSDSPQTGDNSNMILWIALLFVSGGVVIGITVYSKKKKENAE